MAQTEQAAPRFEIGRVLSRAMTTLGANAAPFLLTALVLAAPPAAALGWWGAAMGLGGPQLRPHAEVLTLAFWAPALIAWLAMLVTSAILQAALIRAALGHMAGTPYAFGACLAEAFGVVVPFFVLGLIVTIGILLGTLFFIVPGIFLTLVWSVVGPVFIAERPGIFASMGRSFDLTTGMRWPILAILLIGGVLLYIVQSFLPQIGGALSGASPIGVAIGTALSAAVNGAVWPVIQSSLYTELRDVKEHGTPQALEDVFA